MISIITLGIIVGTAFLVKYAKTNVSVGNYIFVLIAGIVTLLFEPFVGALIGSTNGGGAIQIASTIFGLYFIIWSIIKLVKFKKEK